MFDSAHTAANIADMYILLSLLLLLLLLRYTAKNMSPDQYSIVYCVARSYLGLGPLNSMGTLAVD